MVEVKNSDGCRHFSWWPINYILPWKNWNWSHLSIQPTYFHAKLHEELCKGETLNLACQSQALKWELASFIVSSTIGLTLFLISKAPGTSAHLKKNHTFISEPVIEICFGGLILNPPDIRCMRGKRGSFFCQWPIVVFSERFHLALLLLKNSQNYFRWTFILKCCFLLGSDSNSFPWFRGWDRFKIIKIY